MNEELNLSVPKRAERPPRPPRALYALVGVLLILAAANLAITTTRTAPAAKQKQRNQAALDLDAQKDLAQKLEKQGLDLRAANAWQEYLNTADCDRTEAAKVWYRIGNLHHKAGDYAMALESYYRSGSLAKVDEIALDINRKIQECHESLGNHAALRYELAERVAMDKKSADKGEEVLAEIGGQKITKAELDRRIEEQIAQQLAMYGPGIPDAELKKQKQALFERLSSASERSKILNAMVLEEVLYRKARELKIAEKPQVRSMLKSAERNILARQAMQQAIGDQIRISLEDVKTHYEAHKANYISPEQARIAHIMVKDEDAARKALKRLQDGEKFEDVAREASTDKVTAGKGGAIDAWIRKGDADIPAIGRSDAALTAIFNTAAGEVCKEPVKSDKGVHLIKVLDRQAEKQKTFDEVRAEIGREIYDRKEREVQEAYIEGLRKQYDVVIHQSAFVDRKEDDKKAK